MSSLNKVMLIGRLGKDPEVRHLENGNQVANFSLATADVYKDKSGNKKENTDWHNIVLWNKTAEIAEKYLHKGDLVYIEGKIKTRSWEKDGVTRYTTDVFGERLQMLSTKPKSNGGASAPSHEAHANDYSNDSDLPF